VFVDGLGIGANHHHNPFAVGDYPGLGSLMADSAPLDLGIGEMRSSVGSTLKAVDTTFGVPGLPQSATGQTALLTGEPAPLIVGRHVHAFPTRELRSMLERCNVFSRTKGRGLAVTFLNAYRELDKTGRPKGRRNSCTTVAVLAAGIAFRDLCDLRKGRAVYHDVTGESLVNRGYQVCVRTPEASAMCAKQVVEENALTVFEYFMTDYAGHSQDERLASDALSTLDRFVMQLTLVLDPTRTFIVLSSDHGNIEDMSTPRHTRNPVPLAVWGGTCEERQRVLAEARDISYVAKTLDRLVIL